MDPTAFFTLQNPTEEHHLLRQTVRGLVHDEVEPQAEQHDATGKLNRAAAQVRRAGAARHHRAEADGGAGMDAVAAVIAHHELAKSDPGFTLAYLAHAVLFVNNFYYAATPSSARATCRGVLDRRVDRRAWA